jgi:hypothetical protein
MENMKRIKLVFSGFILVASIVIFFNTCKKDELTQEERITQHEQKIEDKIDDFMPDEVVVLYKNSFSILRAENDYSLYLDSLEIAIDELKNAIQLNYTLEEFNNALFDAYSDINSSPKGSGGGCLGVGYSRGVRLELGVSGRVALLVAAGLEASGGGGIKIVYDFVNMERQVYYYSVCSYGFNFGVGLGAALTGNLGFSGINEVITGIRYHGSDIVKNSFAGQSIGLGFSIGGGVSVIGGIKLSTGFGISKSAYADFEGIGNLLPCPHNMIEIVNGRTSYSIKVTGSLSAGAQADIMALFSANAIGTNTYGIDNSYTKFHNERTTAGTRMAKELVLQNPINGFHAFPTPSDLLAAAAAILYSHKDFSKCLAKEPSIGTKAITKVSSTEAEGGGIIKDDGGSNVSSRGVCWSTSYNPTISNSHTVDGTGIGNFNSKLTGLLPNTTYYVRAYASNSVGTTYGTQENFTTLPSSGAIPTNGQVAYYPFNGNANDLSGNNNNGTVYGATSTADRHGISNRAYLFDGVNDYIEINHSSSLNLSQQISISFWAKFETSANYYYPYHIIEKYGCWGTGQRENDMNLSVTTTAGDFNIFTLNYEYGRFYHFVMIYD